MSKFTLGFGNKIGKRVTIRDKSEYYCGEYISGRYYSGIFKGTHQGERGLYFTVDGYGDILVSDTTEIEFED